MTSSCKTWQILHRQEIRYLRKHSDGKPEFPATYWDLTNPYYIYSHFTDILHILGHAVKKIRITLRNDLLEITYPMGKMKLIQTFISWSQTFLNKLYILSVMSIRPLVSITGFYYRTTLQETNISPKNAILKMIFLFPRWDMLIPWRVSFIRSEAGPSGWMSKLGISLSSDQFTVVVVLGVFFGMKILPSYMGTIIIIQYKDPY